MKRSIVLVVVFLTVGAFVNTNAQVFNRIIKREDMLNRKPVPLQGVREADVIWAKNVWRIVDLREKMNQPLYYPTKEIEGRINLVNLLLRGVEDGVLTAYDARTDDDFKVPITYEQVKERFGAASSVRQVRDFETGELEERVVEGQIRSEDVKQFMVKEIWYFDKQTSTLQVRVLGLCPIQEIYRDGEGEVEQQATQRRKVFWISYPEARELLARNSVFNPYNDAAALSFDDLFVKRIFHSYIVAESNTHNNRIVSEYLSGQDAMMESKRIEERIFNFEQDLWEY